MSGAFSARFFERRSKRGGSVWLICCGQEVGRFFRLHCPGALEVVDVLGDGLRFALADFLVELADPAGAALAPLFGGDGVRLHGFFPESNESLMRESMPGVSADAAIGDLSTDLAS